MLLNVISIAKQICMSMDSFAQCHLPHLSGWQSWLKGKVLGNAKPVMQESQGSAQQRIEGETHKNTMQRTQNKQQKTQQTRFSKAKGTTFAVEGQISFIHQLCQLHLPAQLQSSGHCIKRNIQAAGVEPGQQILQLCLPSCCLELCQRMLPAVPKQSACKLGHHKVL